MTTAGPLLIESEVAEILRLSVARVRKLARAGEIPCIILPGEEYRFAQPQLEIWLREMGHGEISTA